MKNICTKLFYYKLTNGLVLGQTYPSQSIIRFPLDMLELNDAYIYNMATFSGNDGYLSATPDGLPIISSFFIDNYSVNLTRPNIEEEFSEIPLSQFYIDLNSTSGRAPKIARYKEINGYIDFRNSFIRNNSSGSVAASSANIVWLVQYSK